MRNAPKTDKQKAEMEAAERVDRRKVGFDLMKVRDRGFYQMSNGVGIMWHTDEPLSDYEARRYVPDGMFLLNIEGKEALFEKEEFLRYLRWV